MANVPWIVQKLSVDLVLSNGSHLKSPGSGILPFALARNGFHPETHCLSSPMKISALAGSGAANTSRASPLECARVYVERVNQTALRMERSFSFVFPFSYN